MPRTRRCPGDAPVVAVALAARTALLTLLFLVVWSLVPALLGWHVTTVVSGSMEPSVMVGDVVAAISADGAVVSPGQVLLVDDPDHPDRLRLHRLQEIEDDGRLRLKGDANPSVDTTPVEPDAVLGLGVVRIPRVGLPGTWLRSGDVLSLLTAGLSLVVLIQLSSADRRRAGTPCSRCGTPRGAALEPDRADRTGFAAAGIAVVAVVALALPSGASFSGSTDAAARLGTDRFPCFTTLRDDPSLAYGFGDPAGDRVVDLTVGGHDGILWNGAQRVDGSCATNPYATFTGRGGVHSSGTARVAPQVFSIETWFRTTTPQGKLLGFGDVATGGSSSYDRHLYVGADGRLVLGVHDGGPLIIQTPGTVTDGEWHHVVGTMSPDGLALWLDGTLVATDPTITHAKSYSGYWRVGYDNVKVGWPNRPSSHYFIGDLDTVAVYDRALDGAVIAEHHRIGRAG